MKSIHNILSQISQIRQNIKSKRQNIDNKDIENKLDNVENIYTESETIYPSSNRIFKFWIIGVSVVFLGYLTVSVMDLLYLILMGYILSIAIENYISRFESKGWARGVGILVIYMILLGMIVMGVLIIVPFVVHQISDLLDIVILWIKSFQNTLHQQGLISYIHNLKLPYFLETTITQSISDPNVLNDINKAIQDNFDKIVTTSSTYITGASGVAVDFVQGFFKSIMKLSIVFTTSVLFALEQKNILYLIDKYTGSSYNHIMSDKVREIYTKIGYRLRTQFLLCLVIFVTVFVGLNIIKLFGINIPNTLSLAMIAGILEFIPYIGPISGSIPSLLVGSMYGGWTAFIAIGIMFMAIQRLENNVLIPMIMNKTVGVSPALIFICILILGSTMGMLGIILAIPVAIIISVMLR